MKMSTSLFLSSVSAGFPSPAEDYVEAKLDLNRYLVKHPASTFLVRVKGSSMRGACLDEGDLLVVDKSLTPKNGSIIVAFLQGNFTVKRFKKDRKEVYLLPANNEYRPIKITKESDFQIWGVVTNIIKNVE